MGRAGAARWDCTASSSGNSKGGRWEWERREPRGNQGTSPSGSGQEEAVGRGGEHPPPGAILQKYITGPDQVTDEVKVVLRAGLSG